MDELLRAILTCGGDGKRATLVAVDGPAGAGKTTLASVLAERLAAQDVHALVVHMDHFYLPSAERRRRGGGRRGISLGFDWRRLRDQVLAPVRRQRRATYQRYDWDADGLAEWHTIPEGCVTIVEGVSVLRLELREFYDVAIWVDCPRAVRLARGISHGGVAARQRWLWDWMPAEDRYIAVHRPHLAANFVVANADPFADVPSWVIKRRAAR